MERAETISFGELLKTYRTRVRKSQQGLAECLGVTRGTVITWERGDALPKDRARVEEMRRCLQLTDQERDALLSAALLIAPQQIWSVPVPRTLFFTGRKELLNHLRTLLTTEKKAVLTQAIIGLGGIGKTQTAREYIHRYQQEYQAVLWAQADSQEILQSSILTLAQKLALPEREEQEHEQLVEAFKQWLETHSGWLLVLDNVEDLLAIQGMLPMRGQGHVLITTRSQAVGTLARPLALTPFTPKQGALMLLRRTMLLPSPSNKEEATILSEMLGGLPLVLDQAGAFVQETGHSLAEYRQLFEQAKGALLRRRGMHATDHLDSVAVTFELAWAKVHQISPAAGVLLRLCAFLAPAAIPEDLFTQGNDALPPALREALVVPLGWQEVVTILRRYSLLEREGETKILTMHRLVQDVLREELGQATQRQWAERAVRLVNVGFPDEIAFTDWQRCQQLLPHALACAEHIERWHLTSKEAAFLLHQAGYSLFERAEYERALPLLKQALTIREQWFGLDHPAVAASLNNMASLYQQQGKYQEALPLFERALAIHVRVFGPDHPDVAISLNNLAGLYQDQSQYTKALPLLERALAIDTQVYGSHHPAVAIDLSNLATLFDTLKAYKQALPLFQRALGIFEQTLEPSNPNLASALNNLASVCTNLRQYKEARLFYQRALEIHKQAYGLEHPTVAIDLNNMAMLHFDAGEHTEALELFGQALAIFKQTLPDHPNTVKTMVSMASLLRELGQEEQAYTLEEHAQAIRAKGKPVS